MVETAVRLPPQFQWNKPGLMSMFNNIWLIWFYNLKDFELLGRFANHQQRMNLLHPPMIIAARTCVRGRASAAEQLLHQLALCHCTSTPCCSRTHRICCTRVLARFVMYWWEAKNKMKIMKTVKPVKPRQSRETWEQHMIVTMIQNFVRDLGMALSAFKESLGSLCHGNWVIGWPTKRRPILEQRVRTERARVGLDLDLVNRLVVGWMGGFQTENRKWKKKPSFKFRESKIG